MEYSIFQVVEQHQLLKVLVALVIGGLLGLEREYRRKAAGMRTLTLICLGSTLFTILSAELGYPSSPDRVASNILTGVGFIGAGVIFKGDYTIDGITTAATIWIASALGIAIGMSHYMLAGFSLGIVLLLLLGLKALEGKISSLNEKRTYTIGCHIEQYDPVAIAGIFKRFNIKHKQLLHTKNEELIIEDKYEAVGKPDDIAAINAFLLKDKSIHHFTVQVNPL
ncbi:MgtC/SapB family protein [Chitinophaga sp. S165]|uniref:MgtC/SapB family protein n=1 Tax=Chitinophaga sp. S165 TaxID=2135462 RepID=UPI000D70D2AD|nr:MgtC/SapB family protein [Chitinophaga sp. S165]PWV55963.1 putative Mg2+ transporter-C (MgtC) family protein [Chitinophaga sp. S165]